MAAQFTRERPGSWEPKIRITSVLSDSGWPPWRRGRRRGAAKRKAGKSVMSLYDKLLLPRIIDFTMRQKHLARYRAEVVRGARGRVLEIGVGSGLNLRYYSADVECVIGLDPSPKLLDL